jgi:hypothetical protein
LFPLTIMTSSNITRRNHEQRPTASGRAFGQAIQSCEGTS